MGLWKDVQATVFFVTHSIEEAIYLGDRVFILSGSPGTLLHQIDVEPPHRPAMQMQQEDDFQKSVYSVRRILEDLENSVAD